MTENPKELLASIAPFGLRMQSELKERVKAAAERNNRSMNAEIVARLEESFERPGRIEQLMGVIADQADNLKEAVRANTYLEAARTDLEKRLNDVRQRFEEEDGSPKPVLTVSEQLYKRIQQSAEANHRTVDAEALSALEAAFPEPSIDLDILSAFLGSLVGSSGPDGDREYLAHINQALAKAKEPWTVKAGWDGQISFFPYASPPEPEEGADK